MQIKDADSLPSIGKLSQTVFFSKRISSTQVLILTLSGPEGGGGGGAESARANFNL